MKTKHLLTIGLCALFSAAFGQTTFTIKVNENKTFSITTEGEKTADFSKNIIISFTGELPPDLKLNTDGLKKETINGSDFEFTVEKDRTDPVTIEITAPKYNALSLSISKKTVSGGDGGDGGGGGGNKTDKSYKFYYDQFSAKADTYIRKDDKAYYFFDEKGLLLSLAPVNVDADDYLVVSMIVPEDHNMSIQVVGEYNASDLNIRPYETINAIPKAQSGSDGKKYIVITKTFGPFTSDKAIIKFFNGTTELPNTLDVRINKLYNVAIGASFISTDLEKPEFDIFQIPGTTDKTINTTNTGNRTLVTFNVIFYWKPTVDWLVGKLKGKSHITQGRDILKEATFWERLNPTFGVAINSEWKENFFFGGNFEFARGGSVSAGWHYGKVQKLADQNFKLGTDVYTGTKDEIKLTDTWETGFFIGITLDTRLFNKILSRN
jgi:hypothetical protein